MDDGTATAREEPERVEMARRVGWMPGQPIAAVAEEHVRRALWEASQSMGTDEIADFVGVVLHEIDAAAP